MLSSIYIMKYNEVMSSSELQDSLNWLLLRVAFRAKQGLVKISEDYDLTVMQAYTLCLLDPGKETPMSNIATMLGCDASNVTGIVDRLVTGKYMLRRECAYDRRIKIVQLTDEGIALRNKIANRIIDRHLPSMESLTDEEHSTLKRLLTKGLADVLPTK